MNEKVEIEIRKERAWSNRSTAQSIHFESECIIREAVKLFRWELGDLVVSFRPDLEFPKSTVQSARAVLAASENYIKRIVVDGTPESVNFSARAMLVTRLLQARIKSIVSSMYGEYWAKAPAYGDFCVLAHQAAAMAEACTYNNWEFFAPPVWYKPTEEIIPATRNDARLLIEYGDAALLYAQCLNAQMKTLFRHRRGELPEAVKVPVEADEPLTPYDCGAVEDGKGTQEKHREWHHYVTGDNLRENQQLFRLRLSRYRSMHRLVGFQNSRGGRKGRHARRRDSSQRKASASV